MILLKEKADKDLQIHTAEMKENVRCIDHARKLEEFMNVKGLRIPSRLLLATLIDNELNAGTLRLAVTLRLEVT